MLSPERRILVTMYGDLGRCRCRIEIGMHLLRDEKTLSVEYRNRTVTLKNPELQVAQIDVETHWFDSADWRMIYSPILGKYPAESDNLDRLSNALSYLSMYESGMAEMLTLINIRQNRLQNAERKVLLDKPHAFLTNVTGERRPATWSSACLNRTTWT